MHPDEQPTSPGLVRRLVADQLPQWAGLDIRLVASAGTDNALFRLGDDLVVRLPRIGWAVDHVEKEQTWLPRLAPHVPVPVPEPEPVALGGPGRGYPWGWSVYRWLDCGSSPLVDRLEEPVGLGDLAAGTVLVRDGRLTAVIDFGCLGVGEPAIDLLPAWSLLQAGGRMPFAKRCRWTTPPGRAAAAGRCLSR
jgi:aminoglycoside phosphotransferase (APT) family kinase protein